MVHFRYKHFVGILKLFLRMINRISESQDHRETRQALVIFFPVSIPSFFGPYINLWTSTFGPKFEELSRILGLKVTMCFTLISHKSCTLGLTRTPFKSRVLENTPANKSPNKPTNIKNFTKIVPTK
jgi:hypothetical protein